MQPAFTVHWEGAVPWVAAREVIRILHPGAKKVSRYLKRYIDSDRSAGKEPPAFPEYSLDGHPTPAVTSHDALAWLVRKCQKNGKNSSLFTLSIHSLTWSLSAEERVKGLGPHQQEFDQLFPDPSKHTAAEATLNVGTAVTANGCLHVPGLDGLTSLTRLPDGIIAGYADSPEEADAVLARYQVVTKSTYVCRRQKVSTNQCSAGQVTKYYTCQCAGKPFWQVSIACQHMACV